MWLVQEAFVSYDSGTFYEDYKLLGKGGIHLLRRGRTTFGTG